MNQSGEMDCDSSSYGRYKTFLAISSKLMCGNLLNILEMKRMCDLLFRNMEFIAIFNKYFPLRTHKTYFVLRQIIVIHVC